MLNKSLFKLLTVLILGFGTGACGQNESPATNPKIKLSAVELDVEKKFSEAKWQEFQAGFKKKETVEDKVNKAKFDAQMAEINKEFSNSKTKRTIKTSEMIDQRKWEDFQDSFKARILYYWNKMNSSI